MSKKQKSRHKKQAKKKARRKKLDKSRNINRVKGRMIARKAKEMLGQQEIKTPNTPMGLILKFMRFIADIITKIKCFVGYHDWRICAGRPGDPRYACVQCWKRSKLSWGEGGHKKYYTDKVKKLREEIQKNEAIKSEEHNKSKVGGES